MTAPNSSFPQQRREALLQQLREVRSHGDRREIARIELQSTTSEVISIRARPLEGGRTGYRIVDEYERDFGISQQLSEAPLNLGELVDLIDGARKSPEEGYYGAGLALCYNDANA